MARGPLKKAAVRKQAVSRNKAKTKQKNERNTENLVRDSLRELGYYGDNPIHVEEQKSSIEAVKKLLKSGSKKGGVGQGAPEFIISSPASPDILLVIECKASPTDHESRVASALISGQTLNEEPEARARRVTKYAVDGVLHYAKLLSEQFHVIAVAVSGESASGSRVGVYLHSKGAASPRVLTTKEGLPVSAILPWEDFVDCATFDPAVRRVRFEELMEFARDLHEFMRDHAKLSESEKPLLVSGTLIALRNKAFAVSYDVRTPEDLQREWMRYIGEEISKAEIPQGKKDNMTQPYSSIAVHPELGKSTRAYPKGPLHELIRRIHEKASPFIQTNHDLDILGQFYGEFLKYTGGDKKALGIVLTPRHITELFARIANVTKDSVVLDICAGTGGFLISAMSQMMRSATTEKQRMQIKRHGLIGVEQQPHMFALAASNMILRGDGKANLYQGSCFDEAITKAIRGVKADVGLLNPPFSQSDADLHELKFVKHMLDCLKKGGTGVAIVPMSRAIVSHPLRGELLRNHTLEAVMSMPEDLFYPVGVVTCVMVFTANIPHAQSNRKTWFGYWKNDGYAKTKHRGRVDLSGGWPSTLERWVEMYRNREVHAGLSVTKKVTDQDEWCAEAYMDTDYATLTRDDFERTVRNYAVFRLLGSKAIDGGGPGNG